MSTITKEWLQQKIADMEAIRDDIPFGLGEDGTNTLAALRIALASLEAEPVAWLLSGGGAKNNVSFDSGNAYADPLREVTPLYTAPPAPVSVPDEVSWEDVPEEITEDDMALASAWAHGFNQCRAAMLQGADRPQNEPQNIPENIPATQFKPVADLYGLTSPTGGETSFTFDAVEARDFIDGGWSCQEYVELGRFQEAMLQNGNSPAQSDCCPEQNYIAPAQDGDSPVLPDGWVTCSERMPMDGFDVLCASEFDGPGDWRRKVGYWHRGKWVVYGASWTPTHWMPLPAAPQREGENV